MYPYSRNSYFWERKPDPAVQNEKSGNRETRDKKSSLGGNRIDHPGPLRFPKRVVRHQADDRTNDVAYTTHFACAWPQQGGLHPEFLDSNDDWTLMQAGNSVPADANYPIKALAELDNICRGAIGFTPTGIKPGLCAIPTTPTALKIITPTTPLHRIPITTQGTKFIILTPTPTPRSMVDGTPDLKYPKITATPIQKA
jgi:hypothetical protein